MARTLEKAKGRREGGRFAAIPHAVINSPNFQKMGGYAVKLLVQMIEMLRFEKSGGTRNNGDLCISWSVMQNKGWRAKDTLHRAKEELLYYGFIELTRQGLSIVKGWPNLYALTFHAIDECGGKLEISPTRVASGSWKEERARYKPPDKKALAVTEPSVPTDKTTINNKRQGNYE